MALRKICWIKNIIHEHFDKIYIVYVFVDFVCHQDSAKERARGKCEFKNITRNRVWTKDGRKEKYLRANEVRCQLPSEMDEFCARQRFTQTVFPCEASGIMPLSDVLSEKISLCVGRMVSRKLFWRQYVLRYHCDCTHSRSTRNTQKKEETRILFCALCGDQRAFCHQNNWISFSERKINRCSRRTRPRLSATPTKCP